MGALLYQTAKVEDDSSRLLGGATGLAVAHLATGPYLYVTARHESAMSVFSLSPGGDLDLVQQVGAAGARHLDGAGALVSVTLPDKTYVLTTSFYENAVQGFSLTTGGKLFSDDVLFDDVEYDPKDDTPGVRDGGPDTALFGADSIARYDVNGVVHALIGASYDNGVTLIRYLEGGAIEHVGNLFDTAEAHLTGVDDIAVTEAHGGRFLIAVSPTEQGVSVFSVSDDGDFSHRFSLATNPSISLGHLTSVETAVIGGDVFVFTGGRGNWPVSAFRLEPDGSLTLTDRVTGAEAVNNFDVFSLRTFEADGKQFLAVGGDKGGLSFFRIGDGGGLSLVAEFGHLRPSQTDPTREVITQTFGDKVYLITAGQTGDGVAAHRFFTDPKGVGVIGDGTAERIIGTPKGDVLIGDGGDDRIKGKSGHDRILDGAGKDQVWGGPGRDVFEFAHDGQQDKLRDFQDGLDLIDLSAAPGVDDLGDVSLSQVSATTILLDIDGEALFIRGYKDSALSLSQIGEEDFIF